MAVDTPRPSPPAAAAGSTHDVIRQWRTRLLPLALKHVSTALKVRECLHYLYRSRRNSPLRRTLFHVHPSRRCTASSRRWKMAWRRIRSTVKSDQDAAPRGAGLLCARSRASTSKASSVFPGTTPRRSLKHILNRFSHSRGLFHSSQFTLTVHFRVCWLYQILQKIHGEKIFAAVFIYTNNYKLLIFFKNFLLYLNSGYTHKSSLFVENI